LAADTFVRAWIARERITVATVRAYLFTIAKNLHCDAHRRERAVAELRMPSWTRDQGSTSRCTTRSPSKRCGAAATGGQRRPARFPHVHRARACRIAKSPTRLA
jgi:DNA-directed RNA polymerase specialized sigma24 family protein